MAKQSNSWGRLLTRLLLVVPSIFNVASHFVACLECELAEAKRSLIVLFSLTLMVLVLMIGGWFCLCGLVFLWLGQSLSVMATLAVMLAAHVVLIVIIGMWMALEKNKITFPNTRDMIHRK